MDVILIIAVSTFIAAILGIVTGFGTSTILIPIAINFLPIPQALLLIGIVQWSGDIWKIIFFKKGHNWKLILGFGIPGLIAAVIGASLTRYVDEDLLMKVLAIFLLIYVVFISFESKWKLKKDLVTMSIGGSLSGFFAGIIGIGGAVRSTFLTSYDLPKKRYIFVVGAIALLVDTSRILTYVIGGTTLSTLFWWSLLLLLPISYIGAYIGKNIVDKIPQKKFRLVIAAVIGIFGIKILLFS